MREIKSLTNFKEPLALFYKKQVEANGLIPIDLKIAKQKLAQIDLPEDLLKLRIKIICKFYRDIGDMFYKYKRKEVPIEVFTDRDVIGFLKEKAKKQKTEYQIVYNPALLTWALVVVKEKDLSKVKEKLKEVSYEEVRGAILKAYEALEKEGDYFLREILSLNTKE